MEMINPSSGASSSDQSGDEWPMFRGALNHTGTSLSTPIEGLEPLWVNRTGKQADQSILSSPAVAGGREYVGGSGNNICCFNVTNGNFIWNYTTSNAVESSPAITNGFVYIGSDDFNMYCLNAITGARVWNYTTGNEVKSSPAIMGGRVYVGSDDGYVYCLNETTGTQMWNYTTGLAIESSPAIASGRVYVGSQDNKMYCLNATTGKEIWNYTTNPIIYSSPAITGGRVYVGSLDDKIYCLNETTGAKIWNYTTGSSVESSPAVAGGLVYVGSGDDNLYCLNATTGTEIWKYKTGLSVESSPAVVKGHVYVGSDDYKFYCLNATTGALSWSYGTNGYKYSSPALANGYVYVENLNGMLYCLPMAFVVPSAPQGVRATGGNGKVVLSWQLPIGDTGRGILYYNIYRGTAPGEETYYVRAGNETFFTDANVENGQIYYYYISAVDAVGEGPTSAEINAKPSSSTLSPLLWIFIIGITIFSAFAGFYSDRIQRTRNRQKHRAIMLTNLITNPLILIMLFIFVSPFFLLSFGIDLRWWSMTFLIVFSAGCGRLMKDMLKSPGPLFRLRGADHDLNPKIGQFIQMLAILSMIVVCIAILFGLPWLW